MDKANNEAIKLFNDFNFYRTQTGSYAKLSAKHPVRGYKPTEDRLALFAEMIEWCRARDIDPRLWLYSLFRARCWTFPPKLTRGCLLSENMIPKYRKIGENDYLDGYRSRIQKDLPDSADSWDPNRDLNHTVESLKKRFRDLGKAEVCMQESFARTLGYHPESSICVECPLGMACARQLCDYVTFDIMALRLGKITAAEAKAQVFAHAS